MSRRWTGGLLLYAVLLLIVVVTGMSGRVLPGLPVAEPVRPVPAIGDCLLSTVPLPGSSSNGLPGVALLPCAGPRAGEVVMVFADYAAAGVVTADAVSPLSRCADERDAYLGAKDYAAQPDSWSPTTRAVIDLVGPDPRQRASGQRWAACVVHPAPIAERAGFGGPARDVLLRPGTDGAAVSSCSDRPARSTVSCLERHSAEQFGIMAVTPGMSQDVVQASCTELVRQITLMPDPTAAGVLTVSATIVPPNPDYHQDPAVAECSVTVADPARSLTSTLRNLGTAALPLG